MRQRPTGRVAPILARSTLERQTRVIRDYNMKELGDLTSALDATSPNRSSTFVQHRDVLPVAE